MAFLYTSHGSKFWFNFVSFITVGNGMAFIVEFIMMVNSKFAENKRRTTAITKKKYQNSHIIASVNNCL